MPGPRIRRISDGRFRLDGGAMFGTVPKVLWAQGDPADAENRILLGRNRLLVEGADYRLLVDTGGGNKAGDAFADRFAREREGDLFDALAAAQVAAESVTQVVSTHRPFAHCGGNTRLDEAGNAIPSFPSARHIVQAGEWRDAVRPHERSRSSYLARNFLPIEEAGLLDLVEGETEILPGITLLPTPGHTAHHQSLLIDLPGGRKLFYPADLIPTSSHLPLPWIMSYDLEPLRTLETKRAVMARAREKNWLWFFEHEREQPYGELEWLPTKKGERPVFRPLPLSVE